MACAVVARSAETTYVHGEVPPSARAFVSRRFVKLALVSMTAALSVGCAGSVEIGVQVPAGFWSGFADGFLILFKYIGGHVAELGMYDEFNTGWPYDLGFLLGATTFIGAGRMAASSA